MPELVCIHLQHNLQHILHLILTSESERTKNRPLAAGTISVRNAMYFLLAQLVVLEEAARLNNYLS